MIISGFDIGEPEFSEEVSSTIKENSIFAKEVEYALKRYASKDWEGLQSVLNEEFLKDALDPSKNSPLFLAAKYETCKGAINITTQEDYTTVCFFHELI